MAHTKKMKVLVIGSGGREHALVKACLASPLVGSVVCAPGNGGIAAEVPCRPLNVSDVPAIVALAKAEAADFVIVGPEDPLSLGAVDALEQVGIPAYGPNKSAARLEASKVFTKDFLVKYRIPTARGAKFTAVAPALEYLASQPYPIVIKASGLAAGKGVIIAQNRQEAETAVRDMLEKKVFGASGCEILIEEFMEGEEASIMLMVCGDRFVMLPASQDHKRVGENDTGPNTGGMGAYAPAAVVTPAISAQVITEIVRPTLAGLIHEGIDYRGTLYIGIMITREGPKVVEFNVRFGDPECQVLLPLLDTDPVELMLACANGTLEPAQVKIKDAFAIIIVLAAQGYPGSYPKGDPISFPKTPPAGTAIVHAGTTLKPDGTVVTNGGRVLGVTAFGPTLAEAAKTAYGVVEQVKFSTRYFRRDIGARELNRKRG